MRYTIIIACAIATSNYVVAERALQALVSEIQNKAPNVVREIIVEQYGQGDRDIGSGFRIEQWDINGGVLTFHPATGVYFEENGVLHSLIETTNNVKEAVFGSYEMSSLPDHNNHGTSYWLGNLELLDGGYSFKRSRTSHEKELVIGESYFFLHPSGTALIEYESESIRGNKLENVKDGSAIATITFTSKNNVDTIKYNIVTRKSAKMLFFSRKKGINFKMDKAWGSYW